MPDPALPPDARNDTPDTEPVLTEADVLEAMRALPGYLDITTADFQALDRLAHRHHAEDAAGPHPGPRPVSPPGTPPETAAVSPPRVNRAEVFWSWLGAFAGIAAVAGVNQWILAGTDLTLMIGSLGASAVLVYGAIRSPLAQPRNLIGGHLVSALVGVTCWQWLGSDPWLAQSVAVATAIALMHLTRTLHPPGGATALIAVIGSDELHRMGYLFVLIPALIGPLVLLLVALIVNNLPASRRYPEVWF